MEVSSFCICIHRNCTLYIRAEHGSCIQLVRTPHSLQTYKLKPFPSSVTSCCSAIFAFQSINLFRHLLLRWKRARWKVEWLLWFIYLYIYNIFIFIQTHPPSLPHHTHTPKAITASLDDWLLRSHLTSQSAFFGLKWDAAKCLLKMMQL